MKTREFNFQEFKDLNLQLRFQQRNPKESFKLELETECGLGFFPLYRRTNKDLCFFMFFSLLRIY